MKLYIWEGDGISAAYHNDGTLVVLAESPEQAREVVREGIRERRAQEERFTEARDAYWAELPVADRRTWSATARGREIWALHPGFNSDYFDGSDEALSREPDRVVDLDRPAWVAFNGGGYD